MKVGGGHKCYNSFFPFFHRSLHILVIVLLAPCFNCALGQEDTLRNNAIRLYIDCSSCDLDYIRNEITFVNYVRDINEAQLFILVTTQHTGSGGTEYILTFVGRRDLATMTDTIRYVSMIDDTEEMTRTGLLHKLKLGLVRYVSNSPVAPQLSLTYDRPANSNKIVDKWNYWVFTTSLTSNFNGERSRKFSSIYGSLTVNRTTLDLKVNLSASLSYDQSNFSLGDEEILSISRSKGLNGLIVFSISDHWSLGSSFSLSASTYSNTEISVAIAPALEYDFFPYSQSTRRQLRILYKIGPTFVTYEAETIYNKHFERLFSQDLSIIFSMKEPWGSASTTLEGSHYLEDLSKNRLQLFGGVSLRVIEGLSLQLSGSVSWVHDQLSLAKQGATPEEVLLQRRELETQYEYYFSFGFSYSFGSIFNNFVNPRLGASSIGFAF